MNQLSLSYEEVEKLVDKIYNILKEKNLTPKYVFGIPRGGMLPAYIIAKLFNATLVTDPDLGLSKRNESVLIIDDILDSGNTMNKYRQEDYTNKIIKAVLLSKQEEVPGCIIAEPTGPMWINFPWEIDDKEEEGVESNIVRILQYIGEDASREGLLETPHRVQKSYKELFAGYNQNPHDILAKRFTSDYDQMVVLRNIEFTSMCEHHMLPFFGNVSIAYIPNGKVVGISKLARLVECFARRLQIQEQMTEQIAQSISEELEALGVGVVVKARHMCMLIRGVSKQQSEMVTSKVLGVMMDNPKAREEFLNLIK